MKKFWDWLMGNPSDIDILRERMDLMEATLGSHMQKLGWLNTQQETLKEQLERLKEQPVEPKRRAPHPQTWRQTLATHEAYSQQREDLNANGY